MSSSGSSSSFRHSSGQPSSIPAATAAQNPRRTPLDDAHLQQKRPWPTTSFRLSQRNHFPLIHRPGGALMRVNVGASVLKQRLHDHLAVEDTDAQLALEEKDFQEGIDELRNQLPAFLPVGMEYLLQQALHERANGGGNVNGGTNGANAGDDEDDDDDDDEADSSPGGGGAQPMEVGAGGGGGVAGGTAAVGAWY